VAEKARVGVIPLLRFGRRLWVERNAWEYWSGKREAGDEEDSGKSVKEHFFYSVNQLRTVLKGSWVGLVSKGLTHPVQMPNSQVGGQRR
jgi:hypothetical protein